MPLIAGLVSALELASLSAPAPSHAGEALSVEFLSSFLVSKSSLVGQLTCQKAVMMLSKDHKTGSG